MVGSLLEILVSNDEEEMLTLVMKDLSKFYLSESILRRAMESVIEFIKPNLGWIVLAFAYERAVK